MAIIHAVTKWKHYPWERHFKVRIDDVSLKYLLSQKLTFPSKHVWLSKLM